MSSYTAAKIVADDDPAVAGALAAFEAYMAEAGIAPVADAYEDTYYHVTVSKSKVRPIPWRVTAREKYRWYDYDHPHIGQFPNETVARVAVLEAAWDSLDSNEAVLFALGYPDEARALAGVWGG